MALLGLDCFAFAFVFLLYLKKVDSAMFDACENDYGKQ